MTSSDVAQNLSGEAGATKAPQRDVGQRWTPDLTRGGWTPVSDFFLENYSKLPPKGLTTIEAMLVIQLMRHKWDKEAPRPSFATLAARMGIADTAVRSHARSLEKKGYLRRVRRFGQPNQFDLTPLFRRLEEFQAQIESQVAASSLVGDVPRREILRDRSASVEGQ